MTAVDRRVLVSLLLIAGVGCSSAPRVDSIGALKKAEIHYLTDGAGSSDLEQVVDIPALVKVSGDRIVPALINSLADPSETRATCNGTSGVPFGFVCFDLLCTVLEPSSTWMIEDCCDDGLWASTKEEYTVPMRIATADAVALKAVQARWKDLHDNRKIRLR